MDAIKVFLSMIAGALMSALSPLKNPVIILVMLFIFDVICGTIADRVINRQGFKFRKFLAAMRLLCLYVTTSGIIYITCYMLDDMEEGLLLLKTITYVLAYFYFSNVSKNLHESYPKSRFFAFLYFVLSVDILTGRIPLLKRFLASEKQNEKQNENGKD
jgi:hypothetical protein